MAIDGVVIVTAAEREAQRPTQLDLFAPADVTRPDVNIGKWAGWIFASPWASGLDQPKEFSWQVEVDGEMLQASIRITPLTGRKRPTTTTLRVFLALVQFWELQGKHAHGELTFSGRQLAGLLGWKWGGDTARQIQEHLDILKGTELRWSRAFYSANGMERLEDDFNIISRKTYHERREMAQCELFIGMQRVTLDARLVANMVSGRTKPVNYRAFMSIKNDSSANLYSLLDSYLSQKTRWERRSHGLIHEELGLDGQRYQSRRTRLAKLKEFVAELDGKELSSGKLALSISRTADGEDYKLVATKRPRVEKVRRLPKILANTEAKIPALVDSLINDLAAVGEGAEAARKVLEHAARWYAEEVLRSVVAELQRVYAAKPQSSVGKLFMYRLHVAVHGRGLEWMNRGGCTGLECRYQPNNMRPGRSKQASQA